MSPGKKLVLFLLSVVTIASPALAQRNATIALGRNPEPPYCIRNPGGTEQLFWSIEHQTTPNRVVYMLQDPSRTINVEYQVYPGDTGLNIARDWTVPSGLTDGKYWVRVEYWSYESGNEANAEVTFLLCRDTGTICVTKYRDANCNGELDPDDPGVPNWWVCLHAQSGDDFCLRTGTNGRICWSGIPPGHYTVYETMLPGWAPVGPDSYEIEVAGGFPVNVTFLNTNLAECFGACCFHDGHCEILDAEACAAQGGLYQGGGVPCQPNPCPPPPGACCFHDGTCRFVAEAECATLGGIWQGMDVPCSPNPCPQPPGACCFPDGRCEFLTELACADAAGQWLGMDVPCDPNPCSQPSGACCFPDGSCQFITEAACTTAGGTWLGMDTNCTPNPCTQPSGACCFPDGSCQIITEADCATAGGTWLGMDASCTPNPCTQPSGACCFADGTCQLLPQAECLAADGVWLGMDATCTPNPCHQPEGACCMENGECVVLTEALCQQQHGVYYGNNVPCIPNPCPVSPVEKSSWGRIKAKYR